MTTFVDACRAMDRGRPKDQLFLTSHRELLERLLRREGDA